MFLLVSVTIHAIGGVNELAGVLSGNGSLAYSVLMFVGALCPLGLIAAYRSGVLTPLETSVFGLGLMGLYLFAYADVHAIGFLESMTGAEFHAATHEYGHEHSHNGHEHSHNGETHSHNGADHTHDNSHDGSTLEVVIDHLKDDTVAAISKTAEAAAGALFAVLIALEIGDN